MGLAAARRASRSESKQRTVIRAAARPPGTPRPLLPPEPPAEPEPPVALPDGVAGDRGSAGCGDSGDSGAPPTAAVLVGVDADSENSPAPAVLGSAAEVPLDRRDQGAPATP